MTLPRSVLPLYQLCAIATLALAVPALASAQMLGVEETETLVRSQWIESLPEDRAARVGPEGAARLIEMLADPNERKAHANVLLVLGIAGRPGAFEAIAAWADAPRSGEVDRATFKAWQALPFALGHLAGRDARAVQRLEAELDKTPNWHFRQHRGARLGDLGRRGAATSLALTGLPAARAALDRAAARTTDTGFAAHLNEARALHGQRALERRR